MSSTASNAESRIVDQRLPLAAPEPHAEGDLPLLTAAENPTGASVEPFTSVAELRAEHVSLMRTVRQASRGGDSPPAEGLVERVLAFAARTSRTGRAIEAASDRDAAQGVLDYWSAWLLTTKAWAAHTPEPMLLDEFVDTDVRDLTLAPNPYHGLQPFTEADAEQFVGREEAVRLLLEQLRLDRVVLIAGSLGSGKTSLALAGILPRLRSRLALAGHKDAVVLCLSPGADPLAALLRAVHKAASGLPEIATWIRQHKPRLARSPAQLSELLEARFADRPVIVIADQLEELFTHCSDHELREQFLQALMSLVSRQETPDRILLIVRDDYLQPLLHLRAFKTIVEKPARFCPPPLTAMEAHRIIEVPAQGIGLKFDEGIVGDIAGEVAGEVAALPTLQFALTRLWDRRKQNRITQDAYQAVGRPREALRRAAEEVFAGLDPNEQACAERVFLELVEPAVPRDDGAGGYSANDVMRRRLRRESLHTALRDIPEDRTDFVLERYVDAGLIRLAPGPTLEDDKIEVAHEALVSNWPRLAEWLRIKREESKKELQLIATARLWQESGNQSGYLLRGEALQEAKQYEHAAAALKDLVAASERAMQQRQKRFWTAAGAVALMILLVALGWIHQYATFADAQRLNLEAAFIEQEIFQSDLAEARKAMEQQQQRIAELEKQLQAARAARATQQFAPRMVKASDVADPNLQGTSQGTGAQPVQGPQSGVGPRLPDGSEKSGFVWIGSDESPILADANSGTPVLPGSAISGKAYRVTRTLNLRSDKPSDDYKQASILAVVPEGTTIIATGSPIPYARAAGVQVWLPIRVAEAAVRPAAPAQPAAVAMPAQQGPVQVSPLAAQAGFIWIGSEDRPGLRDLASGALVPPADVKPKARYKVARNLVLRSDKPTADYVQAQSLGVVPEGTVVTAGAGPISYTRPNGSQYWLSVQVDRSKEPIVYVQFTTAARPDAQEFSRALQKQGYRVPGLEGTDLAKGANEIRYYYANDKQAAEKLSKDVAAVQKQRGSGKAPPKVVDLTAQAGARNYPGVLELWIDLPSSTEGRG